MRYLFTMSLVLLTAPSFANQCGFRPFNPITCTTGDAVCQCDSSGQCTWVWVNCGN